jgi:autotransporter-associated beta strand protein
VKTGAGALILSGKATSGVTINGGSIVLGKTDALGSDADVNTGGTLDVNGIVPTSDINLKGGSLVNNNTTATTLNNVTLAASSKIGGSSYLTVSNALAGAYALEKIGDGTTTLTNDNTYTGTTTVTAGTLQLGNGSGTAGNVDGDIAVANDGTLAINRTGDVTNKLSGAGVVDVLKNTSFTGDLSTFTGTTNVKGATLTGNVSSQSQINLTNSATYNLGSDNRTVKAMNVENGSNVALNGKTLTVNGTLELTAAQDASNAAIKGGELVLASGSELKTNFVDYSLQAGGETPVYLGDSLTGYTDNGATLNPVPNRLYKIIGDLQYDNGKGQLYYLLKRNFSADLFPNISPQLAPVIDQYDGGNNWVEYMMTNEDDDSVTEKYVQGGFDLVNLSNAMSVLYDTQVGIDNVLYSRSRHYVTRSKYLTLGQCDPCSSVFCGGSGSDRELFVTPIYGNNRGFRLNSGNFRYGYVNDQWALGVGVDQSYGRTRFGLMGVYGEGKALTKGTLPQTTNESAFGGIFLYSNTRNGDLDLLLSGGYLGMENSVQQITSGGNLTGKLTTGLATLSATLTKSLRYDNLYILPTFGIEYGYYHQGSLTARYGNDIALRNEKASTNLAVIPVGVRITRDGVAFGGRLNPEFRARYIANVGSVSADYNTLLIGSPTSALMATRMTDRHAGDIGLGFGWTRDAITLRGDYGYMFGEHYSDQYVSASATWKF